MGKFLLVSMRNFEMHLVVVCCLLLHLFACQIDGGTQLSKNETIEILLEFKSSITSNTGHGFSDWNRKNSTRMCSWLGITCNSQGSVVKIHISVVSSGTITPGLGNLSSLIYLIIYGGSGIIPPELGKLNNLKNLTLSNNFYEFEGGIPAEFGKLHNLEHLELGQLSGKIPESLGNLTALQHLYLGGSFEGGIPSEFGGLTNLKYLVVEELSGNIPESLGNLTSLQHLSLQGWFEEGIPAEFGRLSNLEYLDVKGLSGKTPESFGNLTALQNLYLQGWFAGDFHGLLRLRQLQGLLIWSPNCKVALTAEVANLTALSHITILHSKLTAPLPPQLGQLQLLKYLEFLNNSLRGEMPIWVANCTALHGLTLSRNYLTGPLPRELGQLLNLSILDLSSNNLTGPFPAQL